MKLMIQIPCLNEAESLGATIGALPRHLTGISVVEFLVVDDGSTDATVSVARDLGVDHVLQHRGNRGLAAAFQTGIDACINLGADIIVHTDADNQYAASSVADLIRPIISGEADMVVGDRKTATLKHFSPVKRMLQALGSIVIRRLTGLPVRDCVSGFRAFSREAAIRMNTVTSFSYTIETLFQAREYRLKVVSVPVAVNETTRPSRLFHSIPHFLLKSGATALRTCLMTRPLLIFGGLSAALFLLGAAPITRFLIHYFQGEGTGMIQSLIIGGVILGFSGMSLILGVFAELLSFNRILIQRSLYHTRLCNESFRNQQLNPLPSKIFPTADSEVNPVLRN